MGQMVEFPSNGTTVQGYLALPDQGGAGPGLVVIHEWWGLVEHIKDVCGQFAREGFAALAPDHYHGRTAEEPDEAQKLRMALQIEEAGREMSGAVDFLLRHPAVRGQGVGVVGFCMGGQLAMVLPTLRSEVRAAVPFYGLFDDEQARWDRSEAAFLAHFAEHDRFEPERVERWAEGLRALGKEVTVHFYPGTHHAFFNDERPEVHDPEAAALAWERTLHFLREALNP